MLVLLAAAVCLAGLGAPLWREPVLYFLFSFVCHQQPERSLWLAGAPMTVCARCAGIYFGALLGLLFGVPERRALLQPELALKRTLLLTAVGLLALDGITEAAGIRPSWDAIRWSTGCVAGVAGAAVCGEAWREWSKEKSANPA